MINCLQNATFVSMVEVKFCVIIGWLSKLIETKTEPFKYYSINLSERPFQHQKGKNGACSRMQIRASSRSQSDFNFALLVFTWYRLDFHSGTSSLRFPLVVLHSFTWHPPETHTGASHTGASSLFLLYRSGIRLSVRYENSSRCRENAVRLFVPP